MKRCRKEKRNRGEGYIETAVSLLVLLSVAVLILQIFSCLTMYTDLRFMASEIAQAAAAAGRVGEESEERFREVSRDTGRDTELSFEGTEYFSRARGTVQYGETVCVTLTLRGGFFGLPVRVSSSALSRVYWKQEGTE